MYLLVQLPVTTTSLQLEGSSDTMPGIMSRSPTLAYWSNGTSSYGSYGHEKHIWMWNSGTWYIYIYQYHQYHGSYGSYDNYWLYDTDIYIMISWQLSVSWYIYIYQYHQNIMIITDDILMILLSPFQTIPSIPSIPVDPIRWFSVPLGLFISALTCVFQTTLEDQWDEEMGRMEQYQRISYAIFCFF